MRWILANFFSNLADLLVEMSARIAGIPRLPQDELDQMLYSLRTGMELRINHPCPTCEGEKTLKTETGDDYYACPDCKGLGIDLAYLVKEV
jgi:hypothetical protein